MTPPTPDIQYVRFVVTAHCEALRRGDTLQRATWASTRGTIHRYPAQSQAVGMAPKSEYGQRLVRLISDGILVQCGDLQKAAIRRSWSFD